MRKTEKRLIGDHEYTVTQLGAVQGRKALARLAKFIGPAVGSLSSKDESAALSRLAEGLNEADVDYFCDLFAPLTSVQIGDKAPLLSSVFDGHFAGEYLALVRWLVFCFEVNFGNFFAAALRAAKAPAAGAESASSSHQK